MDFLFDLLQGAGIAAAIGIRPFLPFLLVGALAAGDLGIDFDGTDFAFLEQAPALAIVLVLLALSTYVVRRAGPAAPEVPPYAYLFAALAVDPRGAAGAPARWPTTATTIVAGVVAGALCAALGFVAARDLLGRTRKRLDADAASALTLYAEGAALARRRRLRAVPAARRPRDRRARLRCCSAAAAAPARSTPACASCDERGGAKPKKLVLTVIDAMKPAMLERAVATGRAPALKLLIEQGSARRRLRRRVPVRDARVRGEHRHRRRARRAPDPVDELVPPRRGALRRVRHELQGLADVRLQALAHRHDLQHEPRAPVLRTSRRCSRRSTTPTSAPPARPT